MSSNSRLTVATHILAWMALVARKDPGPVTSDRIARSVNTNPVIIRRALGALSKQGLVQSRRGAHAGWTLAKRPDAISLLDVYRAVDEGPIFALHASRPNQACPIGRGIQPVLTDVYDDLAGLLRRRLAGVTIEDLLNRILRGSR
jgi:Predicted transcriptional regulator